MVPQLGEAATGRDLRRLVGGQLLSTTGDVAAVTALTLRLRPHGPGWVAALLVGLLLPGVLLAPAAGLLIDRLETRRVLLASLLAQAAVCVPLALVHGPAVTVLLVTLLGVVATPMRPATSALLPVERHPGRAQELARTLTRLRAVNAEVLCADAAQLDLAERFDRVLVDPPCSGLGTLQSRPDLRWRATEERVTALTDVQLGLLRSGARHLDPGGTLVYSVCTISRAESETVIERFLAAEPDFTLGEDATTQLLPHRDGTDGFFIARLSRRGPSPT